MSNFFGSFLSLLLALVCHAGVGGGIELASSGPQVILKSFGALLYAAVIHSANRHWTGVLVLLGVCSVLAGVGWLEVITGSGYTGT